jgi:hypothetical protein
MTFDFDTDAERFHVKTTCVACGGEPTLITAPTAHLAALAVALVGACSLLDIDLSQILATVLTFGTVAERRATEARFAEYLKRRQAEQTDNDE